MRNSIECTAGGRGQRGFTLIEILVVMAILAILTSLLGGVIVAAKRRTAQAACQGHLAAIHLALASYTADQRSYPRAAPQLGTPDQLMADDSPVLFAAIVYSPSLGGGRGGPYLRGWESKYLGLITDRSKLAAATMGQDGDPGARPLTQSELQEYGLDTFRRAHSPSSAEPLVLLDPWGCPYHYRNWSRVSSSLKNAINSNPPQRTGVQEAPHMGGEPPLPGPISDTIRDPYGFEVWSNGPNGVNEFAHPNSDDVILR